MDEDEFYDEAGEWTDEYLDEMEYEIESMYRQAYAEITEEWNRYMLTMGIALAALWEAYQNAEPGEKHKALDDYKRAAQEYNQRNAEYRRMVEETARRISEVNRLANEYVNDNLNDIYRVNHDYAPIEGELPGTSTQPVDEEWLRNAIPQHNLNSAKDIAWNVQRINNEVLQGILAGEDIDTIARRILKIINTNLSSARRIARTMVTGAQNRGRMDRYLDLENQGIIQHKVWVATPDNRTRDWHMSMDGQEVELHEPFIDGKGYELMYPGDPSAPPETIYNCRCTMYSEMIGVRRADGTIRYVQGYYGGSAMHNRQIAGERTRRAEKKAKRARRAK